MQNHILRASQDVITRSSRANLLVVGTLILFGLGLYYVGADLINNGLNAVETRAFSTVNILLVFVLPILGAAYVGLILKGKYKVAFAATVISFAILGRTARLGGIPAWDNGEGYTQVIALTHAMIFALAFGLIVARRGVNGQFQRKVLLGLVGFATLGTISQFFTHSLPSSVLLSIGSLWVYVALSYIVFALFEGFDGVRQLAIILTASLLLGLTLRIATTGQGFFAVSQTADFYRVDGFAFGPSVSYAGYLAIAAVLATALAMYESSMLRRALFISFAAILVAEVASTGTRGALLSMLFVPLGIAATRRYKLSLLIFSLMGLAATVLWAKIAEVLSARPIYFDGRVNTIPQWVERVELWKINAPHFFDNFGFGYGIGHQLNLALSNGVYTPSHNTFLDLSQHTGAWATLILLAVILAVILRASRDALLLADGRTRALAILALTAMFSWLFTANTTSTSLVWFYPVEGTSIFYITLSTVALLVRNRQPLVGR